jgi:hypothetical protein
MTSPSGLCISVIAPPARSVMPFGRRARSSRALSRLSLWLRTPPPPTLSATAHTAKAGPRASQRRRLATTGRSRLRRPATLVLLTTHGRPSNGRPRSAPRTTVSISQSPHGRRCRSARDCPTKVRLMSASPLMLRHGCRRIDTLFQLRFCPTASFHRSPTLVFRYPSRATFWNGHLLHGSLVVPTRQE